jgi:hypothetical protein
MAARDELGDHAVHGVDRHRETDAGTRAGRAVDSRIDADEPAGAVEQRTARVSRVDRGIGLDQVPVHAAALVVERPIERGDDAGGQAPVETERIADGEHLLADAQVVARADRHRFERLAGRADEQHGDVMSLARTHQRGRIVPAVRELDRGLGRAGDDVHVRDDVPLLVPHEARAGAARHARDVARPEIDDAVARGDVDHRPLPRLEHADVLLLLRGQRAARRDRPGRRHGGP